MLFEKSSHIGAMSKGIYLGSRFFTTKATPYLVVAEGRRIEIEVGEIVELACPGYLTYRWTLARVPDGSAARLDEGRLCGVNKPGVHLIQVRTSGAWMRELELCAFTRTQMFGATTRPTDEQRFACRGWLSDPARTTEQVIERLER